MREESEEKKDKKETLSLGVSEKWREKHEERMQTVGVVRGGNLKGEERGEREETLEMEERRTEEGRDRKPTPREDAESGGLGLGSGWGW